MIPRDSSDENHSSTTQFNSMVEDNTSLSALPHNQVPKNQMDSLPLPAVSSRPQHSHKGCDSDGACVEARASKNIPLAPVPQAVAPVPTIPTQATSVIIPDNDKKLTLPPSSSSSERTTSSTARPSRFLQGPTLETETDVSLSPHVPECIASTKSSTSNSPSLSSTTLSGAQVLDIKCFPTVTTSVSEQDRPTSSCHKLFYIPNTTTNPTVTYKQRWGIPLTCKLVGGGESALAGAPQWSSGAPPGSSGPVGPWGNTPPPPGGWGGAAPPPPGQNPGVPPQQQQTQQGNNSAPAPPANASHTNPGGQLKGPQQGGSGAVGNPPQPQQSQVNPPQGSSNPNAPPGSNQKPQGGQQQGQAGSSSWAAAAGKNLPPQGANPGPAGAASSASCKQQLEQLSTMREALYSQDGWGGQHVNQDSSWDIPASPEPSNKEPNPQPGNPQAPPAPVWKPNVNNGTELWEATLRNGGQPPPQVQQKTPWGHTPATNIGGTWGEDDEGEGANLWSGGAGGLPAGAGPGASPGWGQAGAGPAGAQGPVWTGGPKKEEWGAAGGWGDPRDPRSGVPGSMDPGHPAAQHHGMLAGALGADPLLRGGISGRLNGSGATADPMWGAAPPPGPPGPHHHIQPPGPPPGQPKMIPPGPTPPGVGAGGNKVSHWKEMPTPPNMGGGRGVMGGPLGGPGSLAPNPRMPVNPAGVLKPDGTPWLGGPGRNGVWDGGHDPSATPWGHEEKLGGGGPWTDSSWGGPNQLNAKKPQGWLDGANEMDPSSWGAQPKAGPKPLTKEILWASKQFRILSEMGFKKDDVENALRGANMNLEDALEQLNALRDWPGAKRFDGDMGGYGDHPQGAPYGRGTPTHNFGAGGPQPPQGANHQQMNRNAQQNPQQAQQPSAHQLRTLVQQIQMAVQAGYLNHQILNQPLAPQTLYLLNQLLQQIKVLHQLNQQHSILQVNPLSGKAGNTNILQVTMQINKAKQYISNLQSQISSQQAIYVKQQAAAQQQGGVGGGNDLFKPHDPLAGLPGNFSDLALNKDPTGQDGGFPGAPSGSSRLNQWKLPSLDSKDPSDNEFSRAPGTTAKSSSPLSNPLLGQGDGTWSSVSRSETGWPDSDPSKDWPSSQANQQFTDLVPEFEPGKPWKGTQMKSVEDDPSMTPGSVVRSPLSLTTLKDTEIFTSSSSSGAGKTSPSGNLNPDMSSAPPLSLGTSTWSFNPPSSASSFTSPLGGKLGASSKTVWGDSSGPLPSTGAGPDLWAPPKTRGPPPGMKPPQSSNGWGAGRPGAGTWGLGPQQQGGGWSGTWVLLKNLTPQVDGSTLKTLCVQHGPLQNFHLYLNHSLALVKYSTREEAIKAQGNLNNCPLNNTTIFAEAQTDAEVQNLLAHLSASGVNNNGGAGSATNSWSRSNSKDTWAGAGANASQLWGGSAPGGGSLWGAPPLDVDRSTPSSLNSFLPPDLLGEGSM